MKRLTLVWASWIILSVVIRNTVGIPLSAIPSSRQEHFNRFSSDLLKSRTSVDNRLFTKPTSLSQEFSLRDEQQSKKLFLLSRIAYLVSQRPTDKDQRQQLSEPGAFSFQFFFPRKLAPPSSSTDPFFA